MEDILKAVWPDWKITGLIGEGSSGAVYKIEREQFGGKEYSALKIITIPQSSSQTEELRSEGYDDDSITERYNGYLQEIMQEYRYMTDLGGNASIVHVDDAEYHLHDDGIGYDVLIRMELLTPLTKTEIGKKSVSDKEVQRIGMDLCRALDACEAKNILHRDIKPQNVFLSEDGAAKLGDFGIAKVVESTTGGTKTGTYKYMAPEVYNNEPYGHKADQYSLGLVLYWLMNERRGPFMPLPPEKPVAKDEDRARERRMQGEALPEPKHGSKQLKEIVLKACAYDPADRYESAAEMLRELEDLQLGRPSPRDEEKRANTGKGSTGGKKKINKVVETPEEEDPTEGKFSPPKPNNGKEEPAEEPVEEPGSPTIGKYEHSGENKEEKTEKSKPSKAAVRIAVLVAALVVGLIVFGVCSSGTKTPAATPTPTPKPGATPASNVLASGACGENCTWTLDADGVLTVSGTGAMYDYEFDTTPWHEQRVDVKQIVVQNGVTRIGNYSFWACPIAKKIIIPQSVTEIGEQALSECYQLETIEVNAENKAYCTADDVLFSKDKTRLICYPIGKNASRYELPTSVTDIEAYAFEGAELSDITLTNALKTIGKLAFSGCKSLSSIVIPPSVEDLPFGVFSICTNLKTVYLPVSIKSFDELAFLSSGLTDINYAGTRQQWEEVLHNIWPYTSSIWDSWDKHFPGVTVHYSS